MARKKTDPAPAFAAIRRIVEARCGGMDTATDEQIRFTWSQLDEAVKKQWMDEAKGERNAVSDGPGGDLPGDTGIG